MITGEYRSGFELGDYTTVMLVTTDVGYIWLCEWLNFCAVSEMLGQSLVTRRSCKNVTIGR